MKTKPEALRFYTTLNKIREHDPCASGWVRLLRHLGKTQADAERYRYLRNRIPGDVLGGAGPSAGCWIDCEDERETLQLLTGEDADVAIDAAMKEGER